VGDSISDRYGAFENWITSVNPAVSIGASFTALTRSRPSENFVKPWHITLIVALLAAAGLAVWLIASFHKGRNEK
jgi:hypothetical protein